MKDLLRFVRNSASADPNRKIVALRAFSKWLFKDYRLTWNHMAWWNDEDFNAYLRRFAEQDSFNTHRKWMLWQLLRLTSEVRGDTAECGVFEGASSWLICAQNNRDSLVPRTHHLFDSFEGVSAPHVADGAHWRKGDLSAGEDIVAKNLAPFAASIRFHKGWIPERFADVRDIGFSFVHVDVDLFQPTRDSIEFFYERLNPGGVFLCDDYAFTSCPGATEAVDTFLADKPEKMLSLPAGGGFFIKGCTTGMAVSAHRGFAKMGSSRTRVGRFESFQSSGSMQERDLQSQILLVADAVRATLDDADLVVQAFDEAQRDFVLWAAVGGNPIPMAFDHLREFLVRRESLPAKGAAPVVEEAPGPALALIAPKLAERFLEQVGDIESAVGPQQFLQGLPAFEREVLVA